MLIKTKQNKNGNLVCLMICQSLKNKLHPRKTNTHTANVDGAARSREHLKTREQWERTPSLAEVQKGMPCPQGVQEGERMHPRCRQQRGWKEDFFAHPPFSKPPNIPTIKAHTCEAMSTLNSFLITPLRGSGDPG